MESATGYDAAAAQERWQSFWEADGTFVFVEQWADAEDAIAALKRGGQGRATFLPLDTIRRDDLVGFAAN